jgi:hypothetical protein
MAAASAPLATIVICRNAFLLALLATLEIQLRVPALSVLLTVRPAPARQLTATAVLAATYSVPITGVCVPLAILRAQQV